MTKRRVVVTDYNFPSLAIEREAATRHESGFEEFQCRSEADTIKAVTNANVVLVQFAPITRDVLSAMAPGAAIIRYGIGFDNIDIDAARELGIAAGYIPDYCVEEVADHTVALILASTRKLMQLDRSVRAGKWAVVEPAGPLAAFPDTTIGFLGMGRIGFSVFQRLRVFGFHFLVMDPAIDPAQASALGIQRVDRDELLSRADVLSLHAPATESTEYFVNRESLRAMKPTAVIVNTARGRLIDENALAEALYNG